MGKIFPKTVVDMLNIREVRGLNDDNDQDLRSNDAYPINIWIELSECVLMKTKRNSRTCFTFYSASYVFRRRQHHVENW